ncbi:hypothetical protein [Lactobacillus sp. PV034]|uniref:hypothetical protein n=1 Tax=Lactobacillus sp. PV034 TaxID=2594495 RepID=UPI00223FA852|nr:hypothetical protein [Lactobacillus sp. PV034]QNQ81043.1 hypothetical protein FP432_05480 [Lactobacillus sp. PV034]
MEGSRVELRRIDQEESRHDKRALIFIMFTIITLVFSLFTFMNPAFMKKQIAKESNSVVVERFVNEKFDDFAELVGADRNGDANNLLTTKQTQPIADALVDYTLGVHWFKAENASLANEIRYVILHKIDDNSSVEAKSVQKQLKKFSRSGTYTIITGFDLAAVTLCANIETLFLVINLVIIFMCLLAGWSLIKNLKQQVALRQLTHIITAAGMWTGTLLIVIYALLALIPLIFNVEGLIFSIGYFLEIASGIFLELVIVGVALFIISTITWELSDPK